MANMSYCRFQNTLQALQDCANALEYNETLSDEEQRAKDKLLDLCAEIFNIYIEGDLNPDRLLND